MNKVTVKNKSLTCVMNLADVPHGKLISSKDFEDGRHIDFYKALPGTQVIVYDEKTGTTKWADVSGWSRHTGSPLELVHLASGDTITTDDDPRAIYGMPIDAENLQLDRDTPSNAYARKFVIPVLPETLEPEVKFSAIDIAKGGIPTNEHPCPERMIFAADYDFGQVLGIFAGDGWWNKKEYGKCFDWQMYISDLSTFNAKFVINWLGPRVNNLKVSQRSYKKEDYEDRYGDTIKWNYNFDNSELFCKAFSNMLGGEGDDRTTGSGNKHLPFWFLSMPREFRLGLINGLLATDGTITESHSGNRKHPELEVFFTSTSRRLIDDIKALCTSLNVHATDTIAKFTVKGNTSWMLTFCALDVKREHIFDNCCQEKKRNTFLNAKVSFSNTSVKGDFIPLPYQISNALKKYISSRSKIVKPVIEECGLLPFLKRGISLWQSVDQYTERGYITRDFVSRFVTWWEDHNKLSFWFDSYIKNFHDRLIGGYKSFTKEEINTLVEGINFNEDYFLKDDVLNARKLAGRAREKRASYSPQLPKALEKVMLREECILFNPVSSDPLIQSWVELASRPVKWTYIENVVKTGRDEEGYDLTVPGYETFASTTGVIMSNTMTYYVPVSDKAVKEAYKLMMPSANQLTARDFTALPEMQEELVSGAYLASHKKKTPPKAIFDTKAEAAKAYREGKIDVDDNIIIRELQK